MLKDNHICKVQSQNFANMEIQHLNTNIVPNYGKPENMILVLSLNMMFRMNPQMQFMFASEAFKLLHSQNKCGKDDLEKANLLCATYGVCMSNFFLCYTRSNNSMALYTSSFSLLNELAQRGILKPKNAGTQIRDDLEKFKDALVTGNRIKNGFKTGDKLQAVRLEPEVYGNTVYFKGTVPKSQIKIDSDFIFPLQAEVAAMDFFNNELQNKVLRFHEVGGKVRDCSKNPNILGFIYDNAKVKSLLSYMYDARLDEFYVPSLGASKFTAGVTNIKFEDVEYIEELKNITEIDLSEVNVNYDLACKFFCDRIISLNKGQLIDLAKQVYVPELKSPVLEAVINGVFNDNEVVLRKALVNDYAYKTFNRDIFAIIKRNSQYFGKVDDYILYCNNSILGNEYTYITKPNSVADLQKILNKGIYKILLNSRKGGMTTVICTNDNGALKQIYGNDYIGIYESDGVKLKDMFKIIERNKDKQSLKREDVENMFKAYRMPKLLLQLDQSKTTFTPVEVQTILSENMLQVEENKTVVKKASNVTVRGCQAYIDKEGVVRDFYKIIDLQSIKEIIRLRS